MIAQRVGEPLRFAEETLRGFELQPSIMDDRAVVDGFQDAECIARPAAHALDFEECVESLARALMLCMEDGELVQWPQGQILAPRLSRRPERLVQMLECVAVFAVHCL